MGREWWANAWLPAAIYSLLAGVVVFVMAPIVW